MRRLVDLLGGTIAVDSVPGQGTAFAIELALRPPPAPTRWTPRRARVSGQAHAAAAHQQDAAEEIGQRLRAELVHQAEAVHVDRARADAELGGDDLARLAGDQPVEHRALARRQAGEPSGDVGALGGVLARARGLRRSPSRTRSSSVWPSNGFSRKSTAPSRIARTAIGTSAKAEIMMIGRWIARSASSRCRSRPLRPGMRTSVTRQPGARGS